LQTPNIKVVVDIANYKSYNNINNMK